MTDEPNDKLETFISILYVAGFLIVMIGLLVLATSCVCPPRDAGSHHRLQNTVGRASRAYSRELGPDVHKN